MTYKPTPIAAGISAMFALTLCAPTQAQQAPPASTPSEPVEQIIVTGVRASMQKSLNQKRENEALVEIITAEDIGKMPDKNVADSLSRVSGVTTTSAGSSEGSFGENEHVQMRGLSSQFTLTTLNGHSVSSGDWFGPNIAAGGRSVSYTLLPSDLVGQITVYKSAQADLIEGGAAGTVDIDTRKPLSFPQKLTFSATVEGAYGSASKKTDQSVSALVNWKNDSNTFGLLAQIFSQERSLRRAGSEGIWWDTVPANQPNASLDGAKASYLSGAVLFEQKRKRQGGYLEAQWKPQNNITLDLSGFSSVMDALNFNTNFMASTINGFNGPGWNQNPANPITVNKVGNTITSIFFGPNSFGGNNAGAYSVIEDVAIRPDARTDSRFINLDAKWVVNKDLTLSSKLGRTLGSGKTTDVGFEVASAWNQGAGYTQDSNGILVLNVPSGDKFVPGGYGIGGWGSYNRSDDSENYGQVDGTLKLAFEAVPSIQFGTRFARHERNLSVTQLSLAPGSSDETQIPVSAIQNYDSDWYGKLPTNPTPGFRPFKISNAYVMSWLARHGSFDKRSVQSSFNIKENTAAAYVMANLLPQESVSGNVGVRVVRTSEDIVAFLPGGLPEYDTSFVDVLPSLNLRFDLTPRLVGRLALNRGMSRPDFGQLAGVTLEDLQRTGVGSNPYLKPIRSNNIDGSLEWYFAPKSMLSAGLYYSKLQGVISYTHQNMPFENQAQGNAIMPYSMSMPVNADGNIKGVNLAYEQGFESGFGVLANYTYANGKQTSVLANGTCNGSATQDCSLYGTSKDSYNLGAYYENDRFSARLSWTYRTTYKLGNRGGNDYFQNGNGSLNFSANYNLNSNVALTFSAQNLNDPLLKTYVTDTSQVTGVYKNGMMIYAGARVKF